MKEKQTMGIAAFVAIMTVISAVAVVGVVSYSDDVAADAEDKEYNIYIDLGGKMTSWIVDYADIYDDDDLVDYGGPGWSTVYAANAKEALTAACTERFGEDSVSFTISGAIKEINGIDGNGATLYPDESMVAENSWDYWIYYYPVQFVMEDDEWQSLSAYIGAYDGDATTFALVCLPVSFPPEPMTYTFEEYGGLLEDDDAQSMYDYFQNYFLWTCGAWDAPFFAPTGVNIDDKVIGLGTDVIIPTIEPYNATNKTLVWSSSDESVATVDEDGKVTGLSYGTTTISVTTANGLKDEMVLTVDDLTQYEIYIDLGGYVSGFFMGTNVDYGDASWETVWALNAKDALTAACEQKFGEGSISYGEASYGLYVAEINGMDGNGISLKSDQAEEYADVYYYPVQYIWEDEAWQQASVTIPNYTGESTTFAIVTEPLTFDAIVHTFTDVGNQNLYNALMDAYAWPGYGEFPEPFISTTGIELDKGNVTTSGDFTLNVLMHPENATNTNITWSSSDESVAVVDFEGNVHVVSAGIATITAATAYGNYQDSCTVVVEEKEYRIYIDLGGTVAGFFLGDDNDYGDASWETVTALNAMDALTAACEQKFGAGSISYGEGSYGLFIDEINGMNGMGISLSSEQDQYGYGDIYYYPVQYIMEGGVWQQASVTIPNYMGESTTLAIVTEPLTFDAVPVEHTFEKEDDKFVYEQLMEAYAWPGWGIFPEPFIAPAEIEVADVTIVVGGEYTPEVLITPENAFNKNVIWYTDDKDIVELGDFHPIITGLAEGVATVTAYSTYDSLNVFCSFTVTVVENTMAEGDVFVQDGIKYTITSLEPLSAKVTGYEGSVVDVFIGKYVDYMGLTFEVESVGLKAFVGSDVKTATVMVDVGGFAFAKTPLKVLKLEGEIDVGRSAFTACYRLINVYVSDEVKSIGVNAFAGCTFVDENGDPIDATLDNLAGHKFTGNYKALKMYVPALYSKFTVDGIIYKVSSVEDKQVVVKGVVTGVTNLDIVPEVEYLGYTWTVTKVSNKAFYDNDTIRDVYVQGVNIGMKSFAKCDNLRIVSLEDVTTVGKYAFASSCIEALWCDVMALSNSAFSAAKLMEVGFGSGLESIGTNAFYGNQFYDFDKNLIDIAPENLAGNSFEGSDGALYQIVAEK